jgi:hypothetical protein
MSKKKDKENIEGEGFVIKDRRSSQVSEDEAKNIPDERPAEDLPSGAEEGHNFQIDFSTFVFSLTSSAFYNLGDIADPMTGKTETNLPAVQQTIDMLNMLKEKTKGNLTDEEAKLMDQMIYELQMKYVEKTKK